MIARITTVNKTFFPFVLLGVVLLSLCSQIQAQSLVLSPEQQANLGIKIGSPIHVTQTHSQQYPAKVAIPNAAQKVIHTLQAGVVLSLKRAEGDLVNEGDLLAEINSLDLLQVQNQYLQALSALAQQKKELQRNKQLFEEGITAEKSYLQAKTAYEQQKTALRSYEKTLSLSGMTDKAIQRLASTKSLESLLAIYANTPGVVMHQYVIPGQRLNAAEPIYKIADLSELWLEVHVPIDYARTIKLQDSVSVCGREISGQVITVGRQVHEADHGVLIRALVTENTRSLVSGEVLEVCFVSAADTAIYQLPRSALVKLNDNDAIFVFEQGKMGLLPASVVDQKQQFVLLKADIDQQSQIVIEGTAALKAAWTAQSEN